MDNREMLIASGVKNLKEFGYPHCTKDNILTDPIYSAFFSSVLEDNKGQGFDSEIDALLAALDRGK